MGATFEFVESNATSGGTAQVATVLGSGGNSVLLWAYKTEDTSGTTNYTGAPVTAGSYSYEKWLRGSFTGVFNTVNNIKYWKSAGSLAADGVIDLYSGTTNTWAAPGTAASSIANATIGTAQPGASNTPGSLTATGSSGFVVLQARASTNAASGDSGTARVSMAYDET